MTPESVTLVFGPPSAGKTLWTTTVARALARGDTLFGAFPCQRVRVLIVQADMPTIMYQERVKAREAFRGSSAWAASADSIITIRRIRRKSSKTWLLQQRFVRTRACEEPSPLLLQLTPALLLEPTAETLEMRLLTWIGEHPTATRLEAVAWLQTLTNERGAALCAQRRAYRLYDRVVSGTP